MYSFYMALKYILYWILTMFRDLGNIVHFGMSSSFCMIAKYEDTFSAASVFTYTILISWPAQKWT